MIGVVLTFASLVFLEEEATRADQVVLLDGLGSSHEANPRLALTNESQKYYRHGGANRDQRSSLGKREAAELSTLG